MDPLSDPIEAVCQSRIWSIGRVEQERPRSRRALRAYGLTRLAARSDCESQRHRSDSRLRMMRNCTRTRNPCR
jgi:hypothetical protein